MNQLFEPLTLRGVTRRNRFAPSPMCQYTETDGHAKDCHATPCGRFALGGFGLSMVEATAVSPEGRITLDADRATALKPVGATHPGAAHADWNIQAGWWLDHRQDKLRQLGPWVSTEETVAQSCTV